MEQRTLLTVELASVTSLPPLTAGALTSTNPAISAIGRYVAFQSRATDLVSGFTDANGGEDVFVRDLILDTTVLISRVGSRAGDGKSFDPDISDSGRFVTFASFATDLAPGTVDDNGVPDVFVHDRDKDVDGVFDEPGATSTTLLSVSPDGTSGTGASGAGALGASPTLRPRISGDGRFVTFGTSATDLALIDPTPADGPLTQFNGVFPDVIKARVADGALDLVSINFSLTGTGVGGTSPFASNPSISRDGSRVAFESSYTTMLDPSVFDALPPFPPEQVYVGPGSSPVELVSVTPDGKDIGDGVSREPIISRNGRHVAFISKATDLDPRATDVNGMVEDIFVRDLVRKTTTLVSRSRAVPGPITTGDGASPPGLGDDEFFGGPAISDTGRFIAFKSAATDLLDPAGGVADTNGLADIFVFDRDSDLDGVFDEPGATTTVLVSVNSAGTDSPDGGLGVTSSFAPSISGDGRLVAFNSTGEDLVPGVSGTNVYVRDLVTGTTTLISATISGAGGGVGSLAGTPRSVAISNSGSRVAFIHDTTATDLDPVVVADANIGTDVFAGTPPPDIRAFSFRASGFTSGTAALRVFFEPIGPFGVGVYRSPDVTFDEGPGGDELLATTTFENDPPPAPVLTVAASVLPFTIGSGAGEFPLPGVAAGETDETDDDYFLLVVGDDLDLVSEFDTDPFAEDNTAVFSGAYHLPGGSVFVHGRDGATAMTSADKIIVSTKPTTLTLMFSGATETTYELADVTGLRIRTHSGDDTVTSGPLPDLIHGGEGKDLLDGGAGDDTIDGGSGPDTITGGLGDDILFDGMGDDIVDAGLGDDTIMATPGSKDIFTDTGGSDTLDFSLASLPITLDLDSTAEQTVDSAGNTIRLVGTWESFVGSPFDDDSTVFAKPLTVPRRLDGGLGTDRLIFDALGLPVTFDGTKFMIPGFGDVTVSGFESIQTVNGAKRIFDDGDPGYSDTGWFASDPNFPQGFNGGVRFCGPGVPNPPGCVGGTATWHFDNVAPGTYAVAASWDPGGDRATDSPFTIRNGGPTGPVADTVLVNQEQNPGEFIDPADPSVHFRTLSIVKVTGKELTVQLTDVGADQNVVADAVRIVPVNSLFGVEFNPVLSFIDDGDPGFSTSGFVPQVLSNNATGRGAFGDVHLGQVDLVSATYNFNPVLPGKYQVSATWTAGGDRATGAPFNITNGGNVVGGVANQQNPPDDFTDGGIPWERLGVIEVMQTGPLGFQWDKTAGLLGQIIADAVRLSLASGIEVRQCVPGTITPFGCKFQFDDHLPGILINSKLDVENTGSAPLSLGQVTVSGTGFSLESGLGATSLPPGGSTSLEIGFESTTLGTFDGLVSFPNNAFGQNPFNVTLRATMVQDTAPPIVNVVSPQDGATVIEGTRIPVRAEAMDDLGVNGVEFLVDGQVVATDAVAPFEVALPVPPGGNPFTLTARAMDFGGNTGTSSPVTIDVVPDQAPVISCVPPSGSFFAAGLTTVSCTATDDEDVARVEFLANGTLFQTVTEEPFVAQFVVPPGQNSIQFLARAFDPSGNVGEASFNQTIFQTPIMTKTSIVVGPSDFSTNDSDVPGEVLVQPIRVFDNLGQSERYRFFPYGGSFTGGVRVATGDVNGDGTPDIITGAGPGAPGGHVKVFSGQTGAEISSFFAFPGFTGGVFVASGDINNDAFDDVIVGAGSGAPGGHVKVFSGQTGAEIRSFFAFPGFTGGVTVAGGDVNGDGFDDIIVGAGSSASGGHVKVFSGQTGAEIQSFFAFPGFTGGVTVAAGDVNADGGDDIIVGAGGDPGTGHVKVFDGVTQAELASFFAYGAGFTGGVRVGIGDVNSAGIITGPGPGAGPHVKVFGPTQAEIDSFFAFDPGFDAGVFVAGVRPQTEPAEPSNVTTEFRHGKLTIRGDDLDNNVLFEQISPNTYRLTGRFGTRINGQTAPVIFTGALKKLTANLNDGDDVIQFGSPTNATELVKLSVDLGRGADTIRFDNVTFVMRKRSTIDTGPGTDIVQAIDAILEQLRIRH